ncbi:MAG: OB-fold domain-containing protein [Pseudomonadales bacterium]|nr:OB-fold domain-containing protein [Pseudomonadales bacterium]
MTKQIPLEEGYMVIPDDPDQACRLLGSYSKAADKTFFPIRKRCPITEQSVETVELSNEGELYSWSFVLMPKMGSQQQDASGGFGVGQIDLPEGVRIQSVIDGKQEDFKIGMKMRLAPNPMATDDDGTQYCGFKFIAIEEA